MRKDDVDNIINMKIKPSTKPIVKQQTKPVNRPRQVKTPKTYK